MQKVQGQQKPPNRHFQERQIKRLRAHPYHLKKRHMHRLKNKARVFSILP
jgi:hypothetical protein